MAGCPLKKVDTKIIVKKYLDNLNIKFFKFIF